jgi:5'-deoxynucleotidase YfbR-like HD superfamily hydrolase
MLSGRRLDLLDPSPLDIEIEDIAHGLARVARWNGQTLGPEIYSVAQHSLLVEAIGRHLDPDPGASAQLALLLHDGPEYVIGDIISPLKAVIGGAYQAVEARLLAAIHLRFGLPPRPDNAFKRFAKRADRIAAFLEATRLAGFSREEAIKVFGRPESLPRVVDHYLVPWTVAEAEVRYLARFGELLGVLPKSRGGDAAFRGEDGPDERDVPRRRGPRQPSRSHDSQPAHAETVDPSET